MRVLHVGEYVQGGVATYLQTLISFNSEKEIENHLLISYDRSEHHWILPEKQIHYYRYKRNYRGVIRAMLEIYKGIADIKPEIIYCHSTWAGVFVRFPYLFKKKKAHIIYNAHGWSFLQDTANWKRCIYAGIERLLSRVTDKIINVSKYEYDSAIRYGIPQKRMCVIYSGISEKRELVKHCIQMKKNNINFLFIGRFDPPKGIDLLLDIFKACKRKDIHLYVVGDNVVSNGMGIKKENTESVTFLGWIEHKQVAAYYEACDAVIMPSRWEAFGLVAIEAMKYSKPVIASNRGALPEIINNGENGFIFDLDKTDELSNLLCTVKKERLVEMGINARNTFCERFTQNRMLEKTLLIIKNMKLNKIKGDNNER